ncbi:MAG TPA: hypothetical protein VEV82_02465, partial [Actinomycetota bacterium]|nr:hypothetical protein [Actinomycetota bacterium]
FGLADGAPSAALYPVDSQSPPRVIASARKVSIHADLGGEWFAHNVGRGRPRLIWRNPDGSVLSITEFGFRAGAVASIDGGVVDHGVVP